MNTPTRTLTCTRTYARAYTYMHAHTRMHTSTRTHTHARARALIRTRTHTFAFDSRVAFFFSFFLLFFFPLVQGWAFVQTREVVFSQKWLHWFVLHEIAECIFTLTYLFFGSHTQYSFLFLFSYHMHFLRCIFDPIFCFFYVRWDLMVRARAHCWS